MEINVSAFFPSTYTKPPFDVITMGFPAGNEDQFFPPYIAICVDTVKITVEVLAFFINTRIGGPLFSTDTDCVGKTSFTGLTADAVVDTTFASGVTDFVRGVAFVTCIVCVTGIPFTTGSLDTGI